MKLDINSDNYKGYKKLEELKDYDKRFYNNKVKMFYVALSSVLSVLYTTNIIDYIDDLTDPKMIATAMSSPILLPYGIYIILNFADELRDAINYDELKKDYPNVNLNVSLYKLKEKLYKYEKNIKKLKRSK